jgi:hypothetical protein
MRWDKQPEIRAGQGALLRDNRLAMAARHRAKLHFIRAQVVVPWRIVRKNQKHEMGTVGVQGLADHKARLGVEVGGREAFDPDGDVEVVGKLLEDKVNWSDFSQMSAPPAMMSQPVPTGVAEPANCGEPTSRLEKPADG